MSNVQHFQGQSLFQSELHQLVHRPSHPAPIPGLGHGEGVPLLCNGLTGAGAGQKSCPKGRRVLLCENTSGQISPKPARIFLHMGRAKTVCCCLWPSTSSLPWGRVIQKETDVFRATQSQQFATSSTSWRKESFECTRLESE